MANRLIRNALTNRTGDQVNEWDRDERPQETTTTIIGSINRSIANRVTKSRTTSKRNSFLSCFHAYTLLFYACSSTVSVHFFTAHQLLHFLAFFDFLHDFFYFPYASHSRCCFSSEHFHVSFFLLNFITQILLIRWKIGKSVKREWYKWKSACQREKDRICNWKRMEKCRKKLCVFSILFAAFDFRLDVWLASYIVSLYLYANAYIFSYKSEMRSVFERVTEWLCCVVEQWNREHLCFFFLQEITKSEANVRSTEKIYRKSPQIHMLSHNWRWEPPPLRQTTKWWNALRVRNDCNGNNIMLG